VITDQFSAIQLQVGER